jgi:hypothetical protein
VTYALRPSGVTETLIGSVPVGMLAVRVQVAVSKTSTVPSLRLAV